MNRCNIFILAIALIISELPVSAQPPIPDTVWTRSYGENNNTQVCRSVQQTSDGGYVLGGYGQPVGSLNHDMVLIKTDSMGRLEWERTFGGAYEDEGKAVQQTSDGGYMLAGHTYSFGPSGDVYLVKTDSFGNLEWERTYGGPFMDWCFSAQQTSDGGYVLAGWTDETGGFYGEDMYLVKTDSMGYMQWQNSYSGPYVDCCYSVQQTEDGGYVLGGSHGVNLSGNCDMWLVKTDGQGNQEWDATFGSTSLDKCYSVKQTEDGGYIMGGFFTPSGTDYYDAYLVKTDSLGNCEWQQTYGDDDREMCRSVLQTPDKGYIFGGMDFGNEYIVKTDSLGNVTWEISYGQIFWSYECYSIYQTSERSNFGDEDFYLVKLEGLQQAWVSLMPQSPPITIPASGGSFQYDAQVTNCGTIPCTPDAWIMVTLPDSSNFGPVLGPVELTLPTGTSLERSRTQNVPPNAPVGMYTYDAYVGTYPDEIWESDSFTFEKLETGDGNEYDDWINKGQPFTNEIMAKQTLPSSIFHLSSSPNPFNSTTILGFELRVASFVNLAIYDVSGRKVVYLVCDWRDVGTHEVTFDASSLPSGIYLARFEAGNYSVMQKMVLVK
jgi:hypothetical protein